MQERIDYHIEKYQFRARNESPRLMRQWADVMRECRETGAGARERLRTALLNVDYVTSFELPFRLLLTRTPQMIDTLRREWLLSQKKALFNGRQRGCVYSLQNDLSGVPDSFSYSLATRIRRSVCLSVISVMSSQPPPSYFRQKHKRPAEKIRQHSPF